MTPRFTLIHNPGFPPFSQFATEAGDVEWDLGVTPTVSLPGPAGSQIQASETFRAGTYEIDYNITITNTGIGVFIVNFDQANHTINVGSGTTGNLSGAGTYTGTLTIVVTSQAEGVEISFTNFAANTKVLTINSLIVRGNENSQQIAEPSGWQDHEIQLTRHPEFHSLVESIFSEDKFVFIGDDNEDGNGGIDFIRTVEDGGKVDEKIEILIEYAPDDETFETYFTGLLALDGLLELPENELELPIIREDFWSKFLNRYDTPIDLTSTEDLDGNLVDPVEPVTINLTSQVIRKKFDGHLLDTRIFTQDELTTLDYIQLDVDEYVLEEFEDKHTLPIITNPEIPSGVISIEDDGDYTFDLRVEMSVFYYELVGTTSPGCSLELVVYPSSNYVNIFFQINDQTPIQFTETSSSIIFEQVSTIYTYADSLTLKKGDQIRIYGDVVGNISDLGEYAQLWIYSKNNTATIFKPIIVVDPETNACAAFGPNIEVAAHTASPSGEEIPTYFRITADTIYQDTQVQGYWLHDILAGIAARIGLGDGSFYSEALGAPFTKARQYAAEGCYSNFICVKGVHLRGYTLTDEQNDPVQRYTLQEKPFFMSFKECWEGANPIFNLGLGSELLEYSPQNQVIRIEEKAHFYDASSASINFDFVYDITRAYDKDSIYKKITVGFNKWQSEDISGIDDPQTKHIYATIFSGTGKDANIISGFIAASLAIEQARRTSIEKSSDYKYDNDTFIIAMNPDSASPEESPEVYNPELDENFNSVTNLLHSDTRYNLILTPLRSFIRWANVFSGCLQSYLNSSFKFVSGEGNFDMMSDYNCVSGKECLVVICDEVAESQDIRLGPPTNYYTTFGHLHLAMLYTIKIPMTWEDYKAIKNSPKKAIGISQTASGHAKFLIKQLTYNLSESKATITAWPKEYFEIQVVEQVPEMDCAPVPPSEPVVYDAAYQAVLDYGTVQGYTLPSDAQKIIENQKVIDMKAAAAWDGLDLFYFFETDGDRDFAKINWVNPGTFNCTEVGVLTFTPNVGFNGNAIDSYLKTGYIPNTHGVHYTLNEAGHFCYVANEIAAGPKAAFGTSNITPSATALQLFPRSTSDLVTYYVNAAGPTEAISSSIGFFHARRVASADIRLFLNGTQYDSSTTNPSTALPLYEIYILARNNEGVAAAFSDHQIGCFGVGASLTGKESALNTILG